MSHQFVDDVGFPIVAAVKDQSKNQLKKYMLGWDKMMFCLALNT